MLKLFLILDQVALKKSLVKSEERTDSQSSDFVEKPVIHDVYLLTFDSHLSISI